MPTFDYWALGETAVTVSGGSQLDGSSDGSHLLGLTLTVTASNYEQLTVKDNENYVDDDDRNGVQRLDGDQTFDGVSYDHNSAWEAEYMLTLVDPTTGNEYTAIAINLNADDGSGYTIEGICFVDVVPPAGVPLTIVATSEGPGNNGVPNVTAGSIAIPCFTPGTLIETPDGPRPVEDLVEGDLVVTLDHGAVPLRWVGHSPVSSLKLALHPELRPVLIRAHAFGLNHPARDMRVSPQHRILIEGWRAEMLFGEREVLVAAAHLLNDTTVLQMPEVEAVTYIHLQCDAHEVLISDGLPTESFNPGPTVVRAMDKAAQAELAALFPEADLLNSAPLSAARPLLKRTEARLLVA